MKTHAWFPMFLALTMGAQGVPLPVLADAQWKLAERQPKIAEAVFQLSEQVKKEELVAIKNYFENARVLSKPLPIEPILGGEIRPDPVDNP